MDEEQQHVDEDEFVWLARIVLDHLGEPHPNGGRVFADRFVSIRTWPCPGQQMEIERLVNRNPVTIVWDDNRIIRHHGEHDRIIRHHGEHAYLTPHLRRLAVSIMVGHHG